MCVLEDRGASRRGLGLCVSPSPDWRGRERCSTQSLPLDTQGLGLSAQTQVRTRSTLILYENFLFIKVIGYQVSVRPNL